DLYNNSLVQGYLQKMMEEHRVISRKLQHEHLNDSDRKALLKKHTELQPVTDVFGSIKQAQTDLEEVLSLLHSDICQQFTREMFDMYQGFACYKNWDFEVLNYSPAEYGRLCNPDRIMSSMPEMFLKVTQSPFQLSRLSYISVLTGITAECQQSRSQLQNRDTAMRVLRAKLYQRTMGKETEQRNTARKQQEFLGGGKELEDLISDLLEHAEQEALLEVVEISTCVKGQPAD
ncbi:hypothetical protein GOODEAATRI_025195, partial [Goodea atripinnis]